jgi:hypothetical protein
MEGQIINEDKSYKSIGIPTQAWEQSNIFFLTRLNFIRGSLLFFFVGH